MDNRTDLSNAQIPPMKRDGMFQRLFGNRNKLAVYTVEQNQNPWKMVLHIFARNRVSKWAGILLFTIVVLVFFGTMLRPVGIGYTEGTQLNLPPSRDYMAAPDDLLRNLYKIENGRSFGVGIDCSGEVFIWGDTRINNKVDIRNVPENLPPLVDISVGDDHVLGRTDAGMLIAWGNDRQRQSHVPWELENIESAQIEAGYQTSAVVDVDGNTHLFGNIKNIDYVQQHKWQGQIEQIAMSVDGVIGLTFDGRLVYLGQQPNFYSRVPEGRFVDVAASAKAFAAVREDGEIIVWGNLSYKGEGRVPEHTSPAVQVDGGRYHFTALLEDGSVIAWGDNTYKQSIVPAWLDGKTVKYLSSDYYQNYALTEDNEFIAWGLKGYLFGSDDFGRDIFIRLLYGGRMTITIAAIAVMIASIIGVVIGGLSGYFGGIIDYLLQRFSEAVASLPLLPFAMMLNVIVGSALAPAQRVYLMMAILGLLSWPDVQRLVRAQVMNVREKEYVLAARAMGVGEMHIMIRYMVPSVLSTVFVSMAEIFVCLILTESSISFLGLGIPLPIPTWGNMLHGANQSIVIQSYWWRWIFVSIALSISVISIRLIGDGLCDAIHLKKREDRRR
ncbi:MAG: ABC transporter permease subunit [Tissierellia bacterium]|nr:ABC transporter permease subunit [Tissierellia bacterium]